MAEPNLSADWLPPGWTVEVRVRKTGKKDKCYTDPSNGLQFFSKPEVFRYLNNIETDHSEFKGKRKRSRKLSAINSPAVAEQIKLADGGTSGQISGNQSSDLVGVMKDEKILESCAGGEGTSVSCLNPPEPTGLEQREKSDPITGVFDLAPVVGAVSEELQENGLENPENKRMQSGINKSKNKKKSDLPRRASKRLAGIEVGPIQELKTNSRAHRVSARRSDEAETSAAENLGDSADQKKQGRPIVLARGNLSIPEELVVQAETGKKADGEPGSPLNFTLKDLWMDPCIEFAIKTLTDAIPIGDAIKTDKNAGSSLEVPLGDLWGDPCIEFAVKTLTGAIPVVDDDSGIQDYLQQQLNPSGITGDEGSNFSNVGSRALLTSASPDNGNGSLQNSAGAGLHPCCEERSEEPQRQTIRG